MIKKILFFAVLIFTLIVTTFLSSSSFADLPSVSTDKKSYAVGDTITISGQVMNYSPDVPVAIKILDPKENVVTITQTNVSADGTYSTLVHTGLGGLMRTSGTYKVIVYYGNHGIAGTAYFDFNVVIPPITTANPSGGAYSTDQTVTLTSDHQSTIYYTTDGSDPTTSSPSGSSPLALTAFTSPTTLRFFAIDTNGIKESSVKEQDYVIYITPPTTTANLPSGSYSTDQTVTLTSDHQATIYYTTDGSDPTTSSPSGSSPLPLKISQSTKLKFFAVDVVGNEEESIKTVNYDIGTLSTITLVAIGGGIASAAGIGIAIATKGTSIFSKSVVKPSTNTTKHTQQSTKHKSESQIPISSIEIEFNAGIEKNED